MSENGKVLTDNNYNVDKVECMELLEYGRVLGETAVVWARVETESASLIRIVIWVSPGCDPDVTSFN